jgi:hypothetical protein
MDFKETHVWAILVISFSVVICLSVPSCNDYAAKKLEAFTNCVDKTQKPLECEVAMKYNN